MPRSFWIASRWPYGREDGLSQFQYGWSAPVHWRHDGIEEIVVLGGDFKPNLRLMA
jgi:hypothetical protein